MNKILDKLFKKSKIINIDNNSKIVIISDCHRGIGDINDNFYKNRNIYEYALEYYFNKGFTYIELGDGDDMWEVKNYNNLIKFNISTFKIIKKFFDLNRFYMIYGNHDIVKRNKKILETYFYKYYDEKYNRYELLFNNLIVYESLVLNYKGLEILLLHGHQLDFFNSNLWILSKFLVRNIWKKIEYLGGMVSVGKIENNNIKNSIDKKYNSWSKERNKIVIVGHTHNPIFSEDSLYFNTGSCIHPDGITCIEIENGIISFIKWDFRLRKDKIFFIKRNELFKKELIF